MVPPDVCLYVPSFVLLHMILLFRVLFHIFLTSVETCVYGIYTTFCGDVFFLFGPIFIFGPGGGCQSKGRGRNSKKMFFVEFSAADHKNQMKKYFFCSPHSPPTAIHFSIFWAFQTATSGSEI